MTCVECDSELEELFPHSSPKGDVCEACCHVCREEPRVTWPDAFRPIGFPSLPRDSEPVSFFLRRLGQAIADLAGQVAAFDECAADRIGDARVLLLDFENDWVADHPGPVDANGYAEAF